MRHLIVALSSAGVLAAALVTASHSHAAPETPPTPAATAPAPTTTAKGPAWEDMTRKDRIKFMKTVVTPRMKKVFQTFDPVKFKTFDCVNCHGKDGKERKFKMPGPDIAHLPGSPEAFQAKMAKEPTWPKWVDFMSKQVMPPMGEMLGEHLFDPAKPAAGGFSCQNCHMIDKS